MGYQSKTYSLSDDVVEAIERAKAGGTSPNKFLRSLMGLEDEIAGNGVSVEAKKPAIKKKAAPSDSRPTGVGTGYVVEEKPKAYQELEGGRRIYRGNK